jgi:hypothetical protein
VRRIRFTLGGLGAMTELRKGKPAFYGPAKAAGQAIRRGEYRADLGTL